MDAQIDLISDLWSFIENSGSTEEFFALRVRVRDILWSIGQVVTD